MPSGEDAHAGVDLVWCELSSASREPALAFVEDLVKNEEHAQWELERLKAGHPTESHHVMARVAHFQELG